MVGSARARPCRPLPPMKIPALRYDQFRHGMASLPAVLLLAALAVPSRATAQDIFTSDFETPVIASNNFQVVAGSPPPATATLGGWNFTGSGGFLHGSGGGYNSPPTPPSTQATVVPHPPKRRFRHN